MAREIQVAIWVVLAVALAISVVTDLRTRKILNIVTFPTIALCLALRLAAGLRGGDFWGPAVGGVGLASGLVGMAVSGILFFVMAAMGGMGMGDVKLAAAVGAGVGFPAVLPCLVFTGVAGGIEALVVLAWRRKLLEALGSMARSALQKVRRVNDDPSPRERTKIPYGVAIAAGTVWGVLWMASQTAPTPP